MNQFDHRLQRLLKAAARAPREEPVSLPPFLETRLLARWRAAATESDSALITTVFHRAVVYACLAAMLSIGGSWLAIRGDTAGVAALTNYEAKLQVMP
jgi:hypothetical protein